jgi:hypothetical protein
MQATPHRPRAVGRFSWADRRVASVHQIVNFGSICHAGSGVFVHFEKGKSR